jgi:hypothetical protein
MANIETTKPIPNMNHEYMFSITPNLDGEIGLYDLSRFLEPYNGRERDNKLAVVTHEIHGKTATVYIVDDHKLINRKQAIKLAEKFIDGDFSTYRLD